MKTNKRYDAIALAFRIKYAHDTQLYPMQFDPNLKVRRAAVAEIKRREAAIYGK